MNEPCKLDEKDYCERHKTFHKGRLKQLALDPGILGQNYRNLWEKVNKPCNCKNEKTIINK